MYNSFAMTGKQVKLISWNINGSGNPAKRRKILSYLKTNQADIVFLQETHLNQGEETRFKTGWAGHMFYSSFSSARNGVMILVKRNINFVLKKEFKDSEGRIICLQAMVEGLLMVLCNIYAPNKEDPLFFHEVNRILGEVEGQVVLAGDFNEVVDPCLDRSVNKGSLYSKGRAAIHMLQDDVGLTDIWRLNNPSLREYTFYSHCHKSYSRIDLFLVSNSLINSVTSCSVKTIALTDHAAENTKSYRWRMNVSLLQDKSFRTALGEDLKHFFELNMGSTKHVESVWEASKAYIRGKFIAYGAKKKKRRCAKNKRVGKRN